MTTATALTITALLVDFLLKTAVCFAAVTLVARLVQSPGRRFALWLLYMAGCLGYAVALAASLCRPAPAMPTETITQQSINSTAHSLWLLPGAFASSAPLLLSLAAIVYVAVLLVAFGLHLQRRRLLRRALHFAYEPSPAIRALACSLADSLGIAEAGVRILPGLASPATIGWLRPLVLLPLACEQQALEQATDILRHELHHIRRRDWLLDRVARSIRIVLFFQPTISLSLRQLCLERELACDRAVVDAHPDTRAHYAESLVLVARAARTSQLQADASIQFAAGIDFAATVSQLQTRVRAILTLPRHYPRGLRSLVALCMMAMLFILALGLPSLTVTFAFSRPSARIASANEAAFSQNRKAPAPVRSLPSPAVLRASGVRARPSVTAARSISPLTTMTVSQTTPEISSDVSRSAGSRPRFKLEPAADAEDEPSGAAAGLSTQPGKSGPLSTNTNPAIQGSSPSHSIVSVLADAAVILSHRDSDHDH